MLLQQLSATPERRIRSDFSGPNQQQNQQNRPNNSHLFGIISSLGIFRFKRLIQGFINSPGIMQSMMLLRIDFPAVKRIIEEQWDATVLSFLDDIGGGTNDGYPYDLLAFILQLCVEANLTVTPSGIQIGREVVHLGKLLTNRCEIAIADRHMEIISNLPFPSSPDLARRALAFLNYFREFIPSFAPSTANLRRMATAKPFDLDDAKQQFQQMKVTLMNSLPLRPVPTNASLQLFANFSKNGIGAVVTWSNSSEPTSFISRFLSRCL